MRALALLSVFKPGDWRAFLLVWAMCLAVLSLALLAGLVLQEAFGYQNASQDFDTLSAAGNNNPRGMWSDGTTLWVADNQEDRIYAYTISTKARNSSKEITTLSSAGNSNVYGIWSDGTTLWANDVNDSKIYAYVLASGARDSGKDINNLAGSSGGYRGLWSDGTTLWNVNQNEDKVYAYVLATGARDSAKDFDTLSAAGNNSPRGMSSDGVTAWIADTGEDKVFAYTLATKARDSGKDLDLDDANTNPSGVYVREGNSPKEMLIWVGDQSGEKIYAYLPNATVPGPPTGLTATGGAGSISLSWTAPSDTGGLGITAYQYQQDGGGWQSAGTETGYTVGSLGNSATHSYRVRAVNPVGSGTASDSATATTMAIPTPTPTPAPPTPTPTPAPTPTPTPVPLRSVAYLGTVQIAVGNAGGTYGYMADGYGGLVAGRFPGELFTDGRSRPAAEVSVSGGNVLQLTYGDETDSLFHGAFHLRWLRAQFRTADGMVRDEANLWSSTPCGVRSICVSGMSGLSGYSGQVVGLDFFDAQTEVLASSAGGKERIIFAAGAVGADATGFDASAGALMSGVFPGQWFSDNRPRTPEKVSVSHGNTNRRLELAYDSGQDEGLWQTELRAYRTYRLSLRDRDGVLLQQWDMQDILGASSESVRRCGDTAPARRICLPYDDDELDLAEYREQAMVLQVEDITWFSMLKATPAGPVGAQLGLGLFGAGFFAFMARRAKSPQREMTILFAGVAASALPALVGYGSVFWPVVILIIAALSAAGWFFFTKSR